MTAFLNSLTWLLVLLFLACIAIAMVASLFPATRKYFAFPIMLGFGAGFATVLCLLASNASRRHDVRVINPNDLVSIDLTNEKGAVSIDDRETIIDFVDAIREVAAFSDRVSDLDRKITVRLRFRNHVREFDLRYNGMNPNTSLIAEHQDGRLFGRIDSAKLGAILQSNRQR